MSLRIVITGSSSGIGRVLTERLVRAGHEVWGLARRAQEEFPTRPPERYRHTPCDVSDWLAVQTAARDLSAQWPTLDGLVCCAGVQGAIGPAMTLDPTAWSATIRANLDATFYSIAAFHPFLRPVGNRAKVICFSGGGAASPRPNFSAYGVAKAGIVRLVETLAQEWTGQPIDINAVAPGALSTRLTEETIALGPAVVGAVEYADAQKVVAQGDAGFEKVGGLVEYLLSRDSDGITGRLLSAPWDPWPTLADHLPELAASDIYTLRRILPEDRGKSW